MSDVRKALEELLAAEEDLFPYEMHGIEAQRAWAERRKNARTAARVALSQPAPGAAPVGAVPEVVEEAMRLIQEFGEAMSSRGFLCHLSDLHEDYGAALDESCRCIEALRSFLISNLK